MHLMTVLRLNSLAADVDFYFFVDKTLLWRTNCVEHKRSFALLCVCSCILLQAPNKRKHLKPFNLAVELRPELLTRLVTKTKSNHDLCNI